MPLPEIKLILPSTFIHNLIEILWIGIAPIE
jgi:hypothetical protein